MNMPITVIMPMAGSGSRFASRGFDLPKPLIPIEDVPFFAWALAGIETALPAVERFVFVVQREHIEKHAIDAQILRRVPTATIVTLDGVTGGAAETAYKGLQAVIDEPCVADNPIVIADCDVSVIAPNLMLALSDAKARDGGVLTTFLGRGNPAYSYAILDDEGRLTGTIEKEAASPYALAGCYGFGVAKTYLARFERYQKACTYPETYVSGVFQSMIADRKDRIRLIHSSFHESFGTPAEYDALNREKFTATLRPNVRRVVSE